MATESTGNRNPGALAARVRFLQDELAATSATLWHILAALDPDLLAMQRTLGWTDEQAALWLASELSHLEDPGDWRAQVRAWLLQLRRTTQGYVA
jgi:hypothetical protein